MPDRFVILPKRGLRSAEFPVSPATSNFFHALSVGAQSGLEAANEGSSIRVIDSIGTDGAKLVELSSGQREALLAERSDIRIEPVVYYSLALLRPESVRAEPADFSLEAVKINIALKVVDSASGAAVSGCKVSALTDVINRIGAEGLTNDGGSVTLSLRSAKLQRLVVYPPLRGYWGFVANDVEISDGQVFQLTPIKPGHIDCVRHFAGRATSKEGEGVRVAVIDTGTGPHPDLLNCSGDPDNGEGHGTHVAGIIGGQGTSDAAFKGIAPGVQMVSYRVFDHPGGLSANFTIAKAIDQAVQDKCDLLNLSLTIEPTDPAGFLVDPVVQSALEDARNAGCLAICSAGNNSHKPVDFPARDPLAIAVSAFGRIGTFLNGSIEELQVREPFGMDKANFLAGFSNVGPEIGLCAPGVGVISTVPGGYGVLSGTSMACPAATGLLARLLARDKVTLQWSRNSVRAERIAQLAYTNANLLGFGKDFEGHGLINAPADAGQS